MERGWDPTWPEACWLRWLVKDVSDVSFEIWAGKGSWFSVVTEIRKLYLEPGICMLFKDTVVLSPGHFPHDSFME